ncbi:ATP-grasp domain-containing protein [Microbacterium esteraromaticum]|uniref:ATP-grasp domain-containing protein n=1 Tax=Microbacterium esteraromaticum TaxID=57043 RepID=A0A7D8AJI3_9MICO|nr:ATP-grasp domain-containing protein [Microbacterium esteraromaticum]QMU97425.1 ATP-grasp domain-containing protein [Microbacterium esteraromaticum]
MSRLLVLGVAAVQDDLIVRAQRDGHHVIACAGSADGPGAARADVFIEQNFAEVDEIVALAEAHAVDAIYSVGSDRAMPVVGEASERLGLPVLASAASALVCNDKLLMRERLGPDTTGNVPFFRVSSGAGPVPGLAFPFIVKPNDSQGQRGVALVHDEREYRDAVEAAVAHSRNGQAIVERYLDGPEISVNGYLVDGELVFCAVSDRNTWDGHVGLVREHRLPSLNATERTVGLARDLLEQLATAMKVANGPIYAQMKVVDGEPFVLEVSPRLDGCHLWRLIEYTRGVNLLDVVVDHLLNGDVPDRKRFEPARQVAGTLEFLAQPPGRMNQRFDDREADFEQYYYAQDDVVRPINGRMDKVGYRVRSDA